ncbi:hypothetical protein BV22DRAFT_1051850 [Leucogyrophana mollusca]|uniref:Uncharacterized protein n=1 Tax=Leucogyrophana mollusca TaxID=85980 RepID=A0ACB8AXI9_9AGAM|nr:hypothetical protein BV22DRAFT_1051850 [Leucogyrophana mollusca]
MGTRLITDREYLFSGQERDAAMVSIRRGLPPLTTADHNTGHRVFNTSAAMQKFLSRTAKEKQVNEQQGLVAAQTSPDQSIDRKRLLRTSFGIFYTTYIHHWNRRWVTFLGVNKRTLHIFNGVFPNVNYMIYTNGAVFAVTLLCISEWRSNISSTALALVIGFVNCVTDLPNQEVAQLLLQCYSFLYEDTDNPDHTWPYRSIDYVNVPALNTEELASGGMMHGILVACTIVLERALKFIQDDIINVDEVLTSIEQGKFTVKLPKVMNPNTSKMTTGPYQFAIANWRDEHVSWLQSVGSKDKATLKDIIESARKLLKKTAYCLL